MLEALRMYERGDASKEDIDQAIFNLVVQLRMKHFLILGYETWCWLSNGSISVGRLCWT